MIQRLLWKCKRSRTTKTVLKENTVGRFILPEFKIYSKAIVVKYSTGWQRVRYRYRLIDGIKSPEINTYIDVQLIFNKGAKIIQWRKEL